MPEMKNDTTPPADAPSTPSPLAALDTIALSAAPEATKKAPGAPAEAPVRVDPKARRPKTLYVFANPWHGELDHNHRANTAQPWDPDNHNPGRGFVGARAHVDEDGEHYFEFEQFDHELELLPDAEPIALPEFGEAGRSTSYLQAIRGGALLPADPKTHAAAWGSDKNYVDVAQRLAWAKEGRLVQHRRDHGEDPTPKPRPKKGEGRVGPAHAARVLSSVQPAPANPAERAVAAKGALETMKAASAAKGV